jgi:hypothetical protein
MDATRGDVMSSDTEHECRFDVSCLGTLWVECECGRTIECAGCPECYELRNLDDDTGDT